MAAMRMPDQSRRLVKGPATATIGGIAAPSAAPKSASSCDELKAVLTSVPATEPTTASSNGRAVSGGFLFGSPAGSGVLTSITFTIVMDGNDPRDP